jgi:Questin oxidase-like
VVYLQVAKVLDRGHGLFLKLPTWLDTMPLNVMLQAMHKAIAVLYLVSAGEPQRRRSGNFLVLHLVTALWGAEHMARSLVADAGRRDALKCYWAAALAIAATSSGGLPSREALQCTWDKYADAHDAEPVDGMATGGAVNRDHVPPGRAAAYEDEESYKGVDEEVALRDGSTVNAAWQRTVQRAFAEEEEHNIKVAYVQHELWGRYGRWSAFRVAAATFTDTPDIGPGKTTFSA